MTSLRPENPSGNSPAEQRLAALATYSASPFASLDEAINETLAVLSDLTDISLTMIHRLEGEHLIVSHACDRMGLGIQPPVTVRRVDTFCDKVLESVSPLTVRDADADPRWQQLPGKLLVGTRSYVSVPIVFGDGRLFGTLCGHDRRVLDLGQSEIDAMLILARNIASQIERDETLAREARIARELAVQNQELSDALRQLTALREVIESISSELDLQALLQQVVGSAVGLLAAHAGAISLVGENLDAPRRLVAVHNLDAAGIETRAIPSREGLMGEVIDSRGPVIVERYENVAQPLPDSAFHHLAPWIAVPIWWQNEIIGTFGVAAADPDRRFGDREIDLLTSFSKHAAVAIENARLYAASRNLGVAEERNRLAREIHDTLAQSLLTLTFQLRAARGLVNSEPERAAAELLAAEANARAALEEARRSVWNLAPVALETGSLVEALPGETAPGRAGIPARLIVSGTPRPLAADAQLALLRITQESITNARKHANASRVEVRLEFGDTAVSIAIADDGRGLDPQLAAHGPAPHGGFGLSGMAERLRQLGGRMEIARGIGGGNGTTIMVWIPYPPPPAAESAAGAAEPGRTASVVRSEGARFRVVVVDDHPATRAGLAALLDEQPDIAVVGQAADGEEGLRMITALQPEVALIDLRLPKLGGVETIARVARLGIPTRGIVVTSFAQDELVLQALRAGAQGYLLKDASPAELASAVRAVGSGGTYLTPLVAGKLATSLTQGDRLTRREREVLLLIGRGLADKEIAAELGTTAKTAQYHVANLLDKLGAQNRTDAVRIGYARGLIDV